ncbi:MAG: hypothetical protein HDR34_04450 [Treponema sp.]|nr:hypothetical protein [Treponema sp.]
MKLTTSSLTVNRQIGICGGEINGTKGKSKEHINAVDELFRFVGEFTRLKN